MGNCCMWGFAGCFRLPVVFQYVINLWPLPTRFLIFQFRIWHHLPGIWHRRSIYGLHQLGIYFPDQFYHFTNSEFYITCSVFDIADRFMASTNLVFDTPDRMIAFASWVGLPPIRWMLPPIGWMTPPAGWMTHLAGEWLCQLVEGLYQLSFWHPHQFMASTNSKFDIPDQMIAFASWEEASANQVNAFANGEEAFAAQVKAFANRVNARTRWVNDSAGWLKAFINQVEAQSKGL